MVMSVMYKWQTKGGDERIWKGFLLIQRHTAPVLRLLTSASLALEGSVDRKRVSEKSLGLKVALFWYPDLGMDNDQRN